MSDRIAELEEENKMLLDCLNGSTKATYTAEMYDKEMKRIAQKCCAIAAGRMRRMGRKGRAMSSRPKTADEIAFLIRKEFNLPEAS